MGFLKAFDLSAFKEISNEISRPQGLIWLLVFLLFAGTAILYLFKNDYWWLSGLLAIVCSQYLIFTNWQDARFGTLANVFLLLFSVLAMGSFNFKKNIQQEISAAFNAIPAEAKFTDQSKPKPELEQLPTPVQKWLQTSGAMEVADIENVFLQQTVKMKMEPEQKEWYTTKAKQFFKINPPLFNWTIDMNTNPFVNIIGRDKFENGKGEILIKLYGLIPIVNEKNNEKIDEGALQRYLAETIWFPTAALSPYIVWESIDNYSARATLNYAGSQGSGIFHFNEVGEVIKFTTMRYRSGEPAAQRKAWRIENLSTAVKNGVRIPVQSTVTWTMDEEDWTWLELKIESIDYNLETAPLLEK